MNIDNNIGGAPYQGRSQHIEKVQTEAATTEVAPSSFTGSTISFVNALESTSLASMLWTVNRAEPTAPQAVPANAAASPALDLADAAWVHQAYIEH